MKTLYVLLADKAWGKLYRFSCRDEQLTLIYHQRNLTNPPCEKLVRHDLTAQDGSGKRSADDDDFARSLAKMLKADCQAGMFDGLIVFSSREFLAVIYEYLGPECRERWLAGIVQIPSLLSEQTLLASVQNQLAKQRTSQAPALSSAS